MNENFIPKTTAKEMPSLLQEILEQYETLKGKEILKSLRSFTFDHKNANFAEACLKGVREYFEKKGGKVSYEEVLAVLVRANIMNFVEKGHVENLWYLLLIALLPEEFRTLPKSVVVEKLENEFIKFMVVLKMISGEDAVRDGVLKFLFKENREFTISVFYAIDFLLEVGKEKEKILN
jgi:hypothetical protein